jgi:hypothetical protein
MMASSLSCQLPSSDVGFRASFPMEDFAAFHRESFPPSGWRGLAIDRLVVVVAT